MARKLAIPICRLISAAQLHPFCDEEMESATLAMKTILLDSVYITPYLPLLMDIQDDSLLRFVQVTVVAEVEIHALDCPRLRNFRAWLEMRSRMQVESPKQIVLVPPWRA